MAGNTAILAVRITGDAKRGVSALNETNNAASKLHGGMNRVKSVMKAGIFTAAAVGAGALAYTLKSGFQRLSGIENAQAKMRGLGFSTTQVNGIMKNALNSVKGTSFSLDQAATTAAGAVAAGIRPGKELDSMLKTVANSAAAAGTGMDEMGSIFNKVASTGKAQNDVLQQVADRGIPIYKVLGDQLGKSTDEVFKLASAGQISFPQFQAAMEKATGSVAKEMGGTATGSIMNFKAAVARLGASMLSGVFPHIAPVVQKLTKAVDGADKAVAPFAESLGKKLGAGLEVVVDALLSLDISKISNMVQQSGALPSIGASFRSMGDSVRQLAPAFGQLAAAAPGAIAAGIKILAGALAFVAQHSGALMKAMPLIVAGFVAWRASSAAVAGSMTMLRMAEVASVPVTLANNIMRRQSIVMETQLAIAKGQTTVATNLGTAATVRGMAALVAQKAAMLGQLAVTGAVRAATLAWAGVQWVLNAALAANPLTLIVIAIVAFIAGIVLAYNKVGWFRDFINGAWNAIKTAALAVWNWLKAFIPAVWQGIVWAFKNLSPVGIILSHWTQIKAGAAAVWAAIKTALAAVWKGIVFYFKNLNPVGFVITHWNQIKAATSRVWNAVKQYIANAWNNIVNTVRGKITNAVQQVVNGWNRAKAQTSAAWNAIKSAVSSKISAVVSVVRQLPGRAVSALGNMGSRLYNSGRSLIDGFVRGIRDSVGRVVDAARNVVDRARDFFPFSPAKEGPFSGRGYTTYSGRALVTDFARSMAAQAKQVRQAAAQITEDAQISGGFMFNPLVPATAGAGAGTAAGGVVIESGAIRVDGVITDPEATGQAIVSALDGYFRRRGATWR